MLHLNENIEIERVTVFEKNTVTFEDMINNVKYNRIELETLEAEILNSLREFEWEINLN